MYFDVRNRVKNMGIKLEELAGAASGARLIGRGDIIISGIEYDSRRIKPGMLFIAVPGFKLDGSRFIPEAIKNGATAVMAAAEIDVPIPVIVVDNLRKAMSDVAAHYYDYPGKALTVVGITGTNGKSTSVYLIKNILKSAGLKTGMVNSLVYDTGGGSYKAERTTPEAVDLQRMLAEMRQSGCSHAVIEVSSHALVLSRVENIDFKAGLYTNFSRDHLDFHETMEEYLRAKKLLLEKLSGPDQSVAVNVDVKEFASFIPEISCRVVTYSGAGSEAEVQVRREELYPDRSIFRLVTPAGDSPVTFRLPGRYNLTNAAAAAAAGVGAGIDIEHIVAGLEDASPVPGRFEPVDRGQPFAVILDYAHTPDAVERLCRSAREITGGRLITLFGCGGDRDRGKRPLMGEAASELSDFVVVTSDNPRTEDPNKIIEDILPGIKNDGYMVIPDRRQAIREAVGRAEAGDTILIAGKGNEDYQEIGTTRYPFEDRIEIVEALKQLGYKKE